MTTTAAQNIFMVTSEFGPEFAFNAADAQEARTLVNRWAMKHGQCGSLFSIEDVTGQQTSLLHNEYVR